MSIDRFDAWLSTDDTVALTIIEPLEPVTGENGIFFPPTFAPPDSRKKTDDPSYVIDENGICLVDSVGSQSNRLEPMFKRADLVDLVRSVTVRVDAGDTIKPRNLLDLGHRAADAVVRFSSLRKELHDAFAAYQHQGDASLMAKLAPTSLVFGAWDSRVAAGATGAKIPRIVESTIRAYGVERLSRSAQYIAGLRKDEVVRIGLDELGQETLSELGFSDSPAGGKAGRPLGGVIANGGIRREAVLNLVAVRALGGADTSSTLRIQRYILGLALVAFVAPTSQYLRQGCLLVPCQKESATRHSVCRSGKRKPFDLSAEEVIAFAKTAAQDFKVEGPIEAVLNSKEVKEIAKKTIGSKKTKVAAEA